MLWCLHWLPRHRWCYGVCLHWLPRHRRCYGVCTGYLETEGAMVSVCTGYLETEGAMVCVCTGYPDREAHAVFVCARYAKTEVLKVKFGSFHNCCFFQQEVFVCLQKVFLFASLFLSEAPVHHVITITDHTQSTTSSFLHQTDHHVITITDHSLPHPPPSIRQTTM